MSLCSYPRRGPEPKSAGKTHIKHHGKWSLLSHCKVISDHVNTCLQNVIISPTSYYLKVISGCLCPLTFRQKILIFWSIAFPGSQVNMKKDNLFFIKKLLRHFGRLSLLHASGNAKAREDDLGVCMVLLWGWGGAYS